MELSNQCNKSFMYIFQMNKITKDLVEYIASLVDYCVLYMAVHVSGHVCSSMH